MAAALQEGRIACAAGTSVKAYEMIDGTLDATVSNLMPTTLKGAAKTSSVENI